MFQAELYLISYVSYLSASACLRWPSASRGDLELWVTFKESIASPKFRWKEVINCEMLHVQALLARFSDASWQSCSGDGFPPS